jgi:hypothetical protein
MKTTELREYFAAHAPLPIPDWFKGDHGNNMPLIPDAPSHWGAAEASQFVDLKNGIGLVIHAKQEVAEFYACWLVAKSKQAAWKDQMREKKYFAWRWYYADQMIASRRGQP